MARQLEGSKLLSNLTLQELFPIVLVMVAWVDRLCDRKVCFAVIIWMW